MTNQITEIEPAILKEAVNWLVIMQSGAVSADEHKQLDSWRARSVSHEAAWLRAESVLGAFRQVPVQISHRALSRRANPGRRQLLATLALAVPASVLAWRMTPWQEWTADLRTSTGERKTFELADGTRLVLNTDSAVNINFSRKERRLALLTGEILITTAKDARPFMVETSHGHLQPLGTRFTVRHLDSSTRVNVFEGAVEVSLAESRQRKLVPAGEQLEFSASSMHALQPADAAAALWERGMLLARDMTVAELLAELARHHHGILRCDPAIARLTLSGAFPLNDVPGSLAMLEKTLPVRIGGLAPFWITVEAR